MKILFAGLVAMVALGLLCASAQAGSVKLYDTGNGTTSGGEFSAQVVDGFSMYGSGDTFGTFCLEKDEYISLGKVYQVNISTEAWRGGVNTDSGDPLDELTAYLYHNYHYGTLVDIDGNAYVNTNDAQVDALQWAIWYIEGETSTLTPDAKKFYDAAVEATTLGSDGEIEWDGLGDVRVMQLYYIDSCGNQVFAQDQLAVVPLPPAAIAGLALLCGLGLTRRRRRRRVA